MANRPSFSVYHGDDCLYGKTWYNIVEEGFEFGSCLFEMKVARTECNMKEWYEEKEEILSLWWSPLLDGGDYEFYAVCDELI